MNGFSTDRETLPVKLIAAFTSQLGMLVGGVLITVLIARSLGPSGKGIFTLTMSVATTITTLVHFSISAGNAHYCGRQPEMRSAMVGNSIALALIWGGLVTGACALFLRGEWVRHLAGLDQRLWWMALVAVIPLLLLEFSNGLVIGMDRIRRFSLITLGQEIALLIGLAVLVLRGAMSPHTAVALCVTMTLLGGLFMLFHAISQLESAPYVDSAAFIKVVGMSIPSHVAYLFATLRLRADPVLIAMFLQSADVGYYSIATAMVAALRYLPNAIYIVLLPLVSGRGDEAGNEFTPVIVRLVFGLVVLAAFFLGLTGKWLISTFVGERYLPALPALLLLLPGATIYSLAIMLSGDLMGRGRPQYGLIVSTVAFFANILAYILLIPRFGIAGAAAASSVTSAFAGLMFLHYFLQESGASLSDVLLPRMSDIRLILNRSGRR